jgi:hypothetical protein
MYKVCLKYLAKFNSVYFISRQKNVYVNICSETSGFFEVSSHFQLKLNTLGFLSVPYRCSTGLRSYERGGCASKTECPCFGMGNSLLKIVHTFWYTLYNATRSNKLVFWVSCLILLVLKCVTTIIRDKIFRLMLDIYVLKFRIRDPSTLTFWHRSFTFKF